MRNLIGLLLLLPLAMAAQSYSLQGTLSGNVIDYWPTHQVVTGDTQYCVQSATTYASGATAGTTTYIDASGNSHTLPKIICTINDGNIGANGGNILVYSLDKLDMTNAANIQTTLVNTMASFGTTPGDFNAPVGWYGKGDTNDAATNNNWKSDQPISVGGWIVMPVFRQLNGGTYFVGDLTFIASPDGGAHWCNPNTFFANGANAAGCNVANGDAPICTASGGTAAGACTNAAYLASPHSSVAWPSVTPYDGTTGLMQAVKFFQYCGGADLSSCTGMPNGADSTVYAFGHNGNRQNGFLAKTTAKTISAIMDPAQWQFYTQANYSPTNTGNGTSWTAAGVQTGAIPLWAQSVGGPVGTNPTYYNAIQYNTTWGSPMLLCAGTPCSYVFPNSASGALITAPAPWGPFDSRGNDGSASPSANYAFFHLMPFTAATINSTPYSVGVVGTWSNYSWGPASQTVSAAIAGATTTITVPTLPYAPNGQTVGATVAGFTGCWSGLNGSGVTLTALSTPTKFSIAVNTTGCAAGLGAPTVTGTANGSSQYYQPYTVNYASTHTGGSSLSGNSGVRFMMGPSANTFPRNGLAYFWDFWDYSGATYVGPPLGFFDIANVPAVAWLAPCVSNGGYGGCGSTMYNGVGGGVSTGLSYPGNYGQNNGLQLRDFTNAGGNQVSPAMFLGDASWTLSMVVNLSSNAAWQSLWNISGTYGVQLIMGASAGQLSMVWGTGTGTSRWVSTVDSPISSATWTSITVTRAPGAVGTSGASSSTHIYVNGVEHPNVMSGNGTISAVNVASAPFTLGWVSGLATLNSNWGGLGIWNRTLSPTEVSRMYQVQKLLAARRGISLP